MIKSNKIAAVMLSVVTLAPVATQANNWYEIKDNQARIQAHLKEEKSYSIKYGLGSIGALSLTTLVYPAANTTEVAFDGFMSNADLFTINKTDNKLLKGYKKAVNLQCNLFNKTIFGCATLVGIAGMATVVLGAPYLAFLSAKESFEHGKAAWNLSKELKIEKAKKA